MGSIRKWDRNSAGFAIVKSLGAIVGAAVLSLGWFATDAPKSDQREALQDLVFFDGFEPPAQTSCLVPASLDVDRDGLLDERCIILFSPPDPVVIAEDLDSTIVTPFTEANDFLWRSTNPVQRGMQAGAIQRYRSAIAQGRVKNASGDPLAGVLVRVLKHPEYGYTFTRADGRYELMINGGGEVTLDFQKTGLLRAQRTEDTPWLDWQSYQDVRMLALDSTISLVSLGKQAAQQVARGSVVADSIGSRRPTLIFPQGTEASLVLPTGQVQAVSNLSLRATEYTVGEDGWERLPGELPPTSAYTYAVEIGADEALQVRARRVQFSRPVAFYLENYRGLDVGQTMPLGSYDFVGGGWVAEPNGRVVKIISVQSSAAVLDVNGAGSAATAAELLQLGITNEELIRLASLYAVGQELWRVTITHLTPFDLNVPLMPPDGPYPRPADPENPCDNDPDCVINEPPDADPPTPQVCEDPQECSCESGSEISCPQGAISESIPVPGIGNGMNYSSNQTLGGFGAPAARILRFAITPSSIPSTLLKVKVETNAVGHAQTVTFNTPVPNQIFNWYVPETDRYGREWQGGIDINICVSYLYRSFLAQSREQAQAAWAGYGVGANLSAAFGGNTDVWVKRCDNLTKGTGGTTPTNVPYIFRATGLGNGGVRPAEHLSFDPVHRKLLSANRIRNVGTVSSQGVQLLQRVPSTQVDGDGIVASGPDGSLYFWSNRLVAGEPGVAMIRRRPDRSEQVLVQGCIPVAIGSGGNNTCPNPPFQTHGQIAVGEDGAVFFVDELSLLRLQDGVLTRIWREPTCAPWGLKLRRNQLYFACGSNGWIGVVETTGPSTPRVLIGRGTVPLGDTPVPARDALLAQLTAFVPDSEGRILLANGNQLFRVELDGMVRKLAGSGVSGLPADGALALNAPLGVVSALGVTREGRILFAEGAVQSRLWSIDFGGKLRLIAGRGTVTVPASIGGFFESVPAQQAAMGWVRGITILRDGSAAIVTTEGLMQLQTGTFDLNRGADPDQFLVPSDDGGEYYLFDRFGRHLETRNAYTNGLLRRFEYQSSGHLARMIDADQNTTSFERDSSNRLVAVADPYGVRSTFTYTPIGYLQSARNAAGDTWTMDYFNGGLLKSFTNPRGNSTTFEWQPNGTLRKDTDAAGGYKLFRREYWERQYVFSSMRTAEGQTRGDLSSIWSLGGKHLSTGWNPTSPYGHGTSRSTSADGSTRSTSDRQRLLQLRRFDPRFGPAASYSSDVSTSLNHSDTNEALFARTTTSRQILPTVVGGGLGTVAVTDTISVNGRSFQRAYDPISSSWQTRTPLGRIRRVEIDPQGRPTKLLTPGLAAIDISYDTRGRIASIASGTGISRRTALLGYDANGNIASHTDPLGRQTLMINDILGRPQSIQLPGGRSISMRFDRQNNLIGLTPPGRPEHTFDYNVVDRMTQYRPPTLAQVPSPQTTYRFDLDKRLTAANLPDGRTVTAAYDPKRAVGGLPSEVTTSEGTIRLEGRPGFVRKLASPIKTIGGTPYEVSSEMAYLGPLVSSESQSFSGSGSSAGPRARANLKFTFNNEMRWTGLAFSIPDNGINEVLFARTFDTDGLLTGLVLPPAVTHVMNRRVDNGYVYNLTSKATPLGQPLAETLTWTEFGEPASTETKYGQEIAAPIYFKQVYQRDKLGRITKKTETVEATTAEYDYTYDIAGRLETVSKNGIETARYQFDANGNRLSKITPTGTEPGSYDAQDRMLSYGDCSYAYTANGDLNRKTCGTQITNYRYDEYGNLRQATLPDGTLLDYLIDARNRRVGKLRNGQLEQRFVYLNQLEPLLELDGQGNLKQWFVYAEKAHVPALIMRREAAGVDVPYRVISDHLGSVRMVVRMSDGVVVQRMDYDEYGKVLIDTNPGFQPFGFVGGLSDKDSHLVKFGARDYAAETGRWTTRDSARFTGGSNFYAYGLVDPINRIDLDGHSPVAVILAVAVVAGYTYKYWDDITGLIDMQNKWEKVGNTTDELRPLQEKIRNDIENDNNETYLEDLIREDMLRRRGIEETQDALIETGKFIEDQIIDSVTLDPALKKLRKIEKNCP